MKLRLTLHHLVNFGSLSSVYHVIVKCVRYLREKTELLDRLRELLGEDIFVE